MEEETLDIQAGDDFKTEPDKEESTVKTEKPDESDRKSDNEGSRKKKLGEEIKQPERNILFLIKILRNQQMHMIFAGSHPS